MTAIEKSAFAEMDARYARMRACQSTTGRRYQYDKMIELLEKFPILREVWTFVSNAHKIVDRFVKKVVETVSNAVEVVAMTATKADRIDWNGFEQFDDGVQQFYIIELLDSNKGFIWTKIGTSTNSEQRFKQHLNYKAYKEAGVKYIKVRRLYDCSECDAILFEGLFRTRLKKLYPETFVRNDRFKTSELNYNEIDEIFNSLMKLAIPD